MLDPENRVWAEIRLDNIEYNYHSMRRALDPGTRFLGIVKADAYGHGAGRIARLLEDLGADYLAVAEIQEAVQLREEGIRAPLLILGYTSPRFTRQLIDMDITQAIPDLETARAMSREAEAHGGRLKVHIKADSGMGRLGFICHDGADPAAMIAEAADLPGLDAEGIFTHFSVSDEPEDPYTQTQFSSFTALVEEVEKRIGRRFAIRHCVNSGAMVNYRQYQMDMVRPGIMLYGLPPAGDTGDISLKPAMSFKSRIVQIKEIDTGYSVSYGRHFIAPSPRRIAVVSVGYADGLHRSLSGKCEMLVRSQRVPQVGNICMDMCMLDVTEVPQVQVGDAVTIFGTDGDAAITASELAEIAGTIPYELLCSVSKRVPRLYFDR